MVRSDWINKYKSGTKNEIFIFYLLFIVSVYSVYFLPQVFSYIFFGILLILFLRSEKNYFWFAFIIFCTDAPGGLFPNGDMNYGMPMINFPFLVTFQELFIYTALIKVILQKKKKGTFIYEKPVKGLLLFGIFLFFITFFLGTSARSFFESIKWTLSWTLLYSVPKLLITKEDWIHFFRSAFSCDFHCANGSILSTFHWSVTFCSFRF